jgi:DNA-binding NtrC family response regulator
VSVSQSSRKAKVSEPELIGRSAAMQRMLTRVERISRYRPNVLLLGESGTGKDLLARLLHARGPGRAYRFEPQNCATLSPELLSSELFGHERGSFTGAHARKLGLFELANHGTLFLDEIGDMDIANQAKLLRVLEHRRFRRLGGTDVVNVDVQIIAATNRALPAEVAAGRFREDLYYRLKVVTLLVPPLRERKDDIPLLVERFVRDFNLRQGAQVSGVTPALLDRLMAHDWPGNIRELRNVVDSMAVLATERVLDVCDADESGFVVGGAASQASAEVTISPSATLEQAERLLIAARLRTLGSRAEVARSLGIGLRTLYTKLRAYGLAN